MKIFTSADKMVNLIRSNHHLLPVVNRFGIRLGFKDKTIGEVCKASGINTDFFLAIVNTYNNADYFPKDELQSFSPLLIIRYLEETHRHYRNYVLPKMKKQLDDLISGSGQHFDELKIIIAFYKKYQEELFNHLEYEETTVFPYVEEMLKVSDSQKNSFSITEFEKQHTNVEVQINDLKNLIIKYLHPNYDDNLCNEFLATIFSFEKDLIDHARIEDAILIPQVIKIEKEHSK